MIEFSFDVNWVTILIASVASMALGFFWYSEMFLGKPWMEDMGYTKSSLKKAQKEMGPMYALSFGSAVISAFVLYNLLASGLSIVAGVFFVWLGFSMPAQLMDTIFNKKQMWTVFSVNTTYQLASLFVMSVVISFFGF